MRISRDGQVTIPQTLREKYGLTPDSEVELVDTGEGVIVRKIASNGRQFEQWAKQARGITRGGMTTDQIMDLTRGDRG